MRSTESAEMVLTAHGGDDSNADSRLTEKEKSDEICYHFILQNLKCNGRRKV